MGGINQLIFVQEICGKEHGRILEVGSKDYGSTIPFRQELTWDEYVGLDMSEGKGVDVVGDLEEGLCGLAPSSFDFIICCSVLEHTKRPWVVAQNLTSLLAPGGRLYTASPWVWRYHPYPDDYWRISFTGLQLIFPDLKFDQMVYSTSQEGEFMPAVKNAENDLAKMHEGRKYLPYCEIHALGTKVKIERIET